MCCPSRESSYKGLRCRLAYPALDPKLHPEAIPSPLARVEKQLTYKHIKKGEQWKGSKQVSKNH